GSASESSTRTERWLLRPEPVDRAVERRQVHASRGILSERREARDPQPGVVPLAPARAGQLGPVDARVAVVPEDVPPGEVRHLRVTHHVTADDRAVAGRVARDEHRRLVVVSGARLEAAEPLEDAPAVIGAGGLLAGREVDLLPVVLADVAEGDVAGLPVEREAVRIAKPVGPDLGARA